MKKISVLLLLIAFVGCNENPSNLSDSEQLLFKKVGFDAEVFDELKQSITTEFTQFETAEPGYSLGEKGEKIKLGIQEQNGISFKVSEGQSDAIILNTKNKLFKNGYLIFLSENGYTSPSTLSIIKSTDQFDILRIQKTDGINYGLENSDIIAKLKEWDDLYGIEILGADYDWVDLTFKSSIPDASLFAQEVYDFCPDSVDQGVGEIEILEEMIVEYKRLFLWWD
ncbi:DUF4253 domain-containing protein [Cellulophaga sp. E16_2]|uniref:DUF4253 domain-containing protein n=1 Tax=unclassified Cellulophaga TaxID=2634405 RepID=UPI0013FE36D0|nr:MULTISPECIES: DUF4253 domain-containing protein [unclassified Cellulophaga]MBO0593669.1 DUF4253 domain-containing protein [Cellulophaga sp. E16_2]